MKTEQIVLALAVAREKSITKAADSLFISQPTASSSLKKLETEIGYRIFQRERGGVLITDEGKLFLEQAVNIEQALNAIAQAGENTRRIDFSVRSYQLDFSALAFEALCEQYNSDCQAGEMRFQSTGNTDEAIRMVASGNDDVAILMCLKNHSNSYERRVAQIPLEIIPVCEYPMVLICKKNHPIIRDGAVCYDLLREYPGFSGISRSTLEPYISFFDTRLVGQARTTYIMDSGPMRYRLLHKTNGFLFSLPISDEIKDTYDLESVLLENMVLTVFAIFCRNSPKEPLINDYLRLCEDFVSNDSRART